MPHLSFTFSTWNIHLSKPSWHCVKQTQFVPHSSVLVYTLLLSCKTFLDVAVFFPENSETSWAQRAHIWRLDVPRNEAWCVLATYMPSSSLCKDGTSIQSFELVFQDNGYELIYPCSLAWCLLWDKSERLLAEKSSKIYRTEQSSICFTWLQSLWLVSH